MTTEPRSIDQLAASSSQASADYRRVPRWRLRQRGQLLDRCYRELRAFEDALAEALADQRLAAWLPPTLARLTNEHAYAVTASLGLLRAALDDVEEMASERLALLPGGEISESRLAAILSAYEADATALAAACRKTLAVLEGHA